MEKLKILICNAQKAFCQALKLILKDNYELVFCHTNQDCLKLIAEDKNFELLLLEFKINDLNVRQLLKQIKEKRPNLKVILFSDYKNKKILQEALKIGASDYITLPFEAKELINIIQKNSLFGAI